MSESRFHRWKKHLLPWDRMIPLTFPITAIVVIVFLFAVVLQKKQPHTPTSPPIATPPAHKHQDAIKAAFDFAWDGYYKLAFPHDELKPISNTPGTTRNDWGATAVDALGTAILMGKQNVIKIVLDHIAGTDFTHTSSPISVFESTIRYVGGLLSAYELLTGPFHGSVPEGFDTKLLLEKARSLADLLANSFQEAYKMPSNMLDPVTLKGDGKNSLASAGSLVCQFKECRY